MGELSRKPVVGEYVVTTQWGIVLLKHIPERRAAIITYAARRMNGEPDLRTRSGKEAMRQVSIIERALRRRRYRQFKLFSDTYRKYGPLVDFE